MLMNPVSQASSLCAAPARCRRHQNFSGPGIFPSVFRAECRCKGKAEVHFRRPLKDFRLQINQPGRPVLLWPACPSYTIYSKGKSLFFPLTAGGLILLHGRLPTFLSSVPLPAYLELPMKKAVLFSLLGIFLLFGVGLVAGLKVIDPRDRILVDQPGDSPLAPGEMSWNTYKKTKLAMGAFDLANGLTKHDLETMNTNNSLGFHFLVGCLWLALGFRWWNQWANPKDKTTGLRR
jgi:hypothetical protein